MTKILVLAVAIWLVWPLPAAEAYTYEELQARVFHLEEELSQSKENNGYETMFRLFIVAGLVGLNVYQAVRVSNLEDSLKKSNDIIKDLREDQVK